MPKYGVHHLVLDTAIANLADDAADELRTNYPYGMLGAIGPDVFFWSPEYTEFDCFLDIYHLLSEAHDVYEDLMRPIEQLEDVAIDAAIGEAFSKPVQEDIKGLLEHKDLLRSRIQKILTQAIPGVIGSGLDLIGNPGGLARPTAQLFHEFRPRFQKGFEREKDWYWFEMLHYRGTGRFAEALVKRAKAGSARQRAYAYGYLSHIATDVVGHAYVNQVVGGPYRLHVQRHVTVENFMDTWAFDTLKQQSISTSLMNELQLSGFGAIPDEITEMLEAGFRAAYKGPDHPPYLRKGDIQKAFTNFFRILRLMENSVVSPPTPFVCDVEAELLELLERNFPPPPPPPPPSPSAPDCSALDIFALGTTNQSRRCYDSFFRELERWVEYMGRTIAWLAQMIHNLSTLIQDILATLSVCGLRWLLSRLDIAVYEIYRWTRSLLAQLGFVYPEPELIFPSLGRDLVSTFASEASGCYSYATDTGYPRYTDLTRSHLVYPISIFERPSTVPNLDERSEHIYPDIFMFGQPSARFDAENLALYAEAQSMQESDDYATVPCRGIGDAVGFTTWLIQVASRQTESSPDWKIAFANWNLDSDRGYGYKTWKGEVAMPLRNEEVQTELTDEEYGEL